MRTIPGLRDTATYHLSVAMYHRHHPEHDPTCAACGHPTPCPTRRHAAEVIAAAGDHHPPPAPLDTVPPAPMGAGDTRYRPPEPSTEPEPTYTGFAVGGRGRQLPPTGFGYEREPV